MFNQNSFSRRKAQALVAGLFVSVIGFSNLSLAQSVAGVKKAEKYRAEQISKQDVMLGNQDLTATKVEASEKISGAAQTRMLNRLYDAGPRWKWWNRVNDAGPN